jgi:transcriptional regulator with GAF, ATPase, and Fis domain
MDAWLPDLEATEFAGQIAELYPQLDVLRVDGGHLTPARSARRHELLHALREVQKPALTDTAAWNVVPIAVPVTSVLDRNRPAHAVDSRNSHCLPTEGLVTPAKLRSTSKASEFSVMPIAGLIGDSEPMRELSRLIRLVAPRSSTVLIEGETGTGKEVVATALHRLSTRAARPMVVLNCAAIPEQLLEAELFGHTRGAFTGAIQARTGRIEAAHGGTLFLDEIGELPFGVQAKLLRFLEGGELQRVGDNTTTRVDVRVIAATHQQLEDRVAEGTFRLDLYHRLAVFPLEVPSVRERMEDLPALATFLLDRLGAESPRKYLSSDALEVLHQHSWPGNVRELAHVLERAVILAGDAPEIGSEHVRYRRKPRL